MTPSELAAALGKPRQEGNEWRCVCPAHDDHDPSLSITEKDGKILVKCRAGCDQMLVVNAIRLRGLWPLDPPPAPRRNKGRDDRERGKKNRWREMGILTPKQACNGATPAGCRLADYAGAKKLPIEFLRSLGVSEIAKYQGARAVRIPYFAADGTEAALRFRIALDGKNRFKWGRGSKPCLYGAHWASSLREAGYVVIVEGESDTQTLWLHSFAALGLPGAGNWNEERDAPLFDGIPTIYVVVEPDKGGDNVMQWLIRSAIASRARIVRLANGIKDPSALYLANPAGFRAVFQRALDEAEPFRAEAETVRSPNMMVGGTDDRPDLVVYDSDLTHTARALRDLLAAQHHLFDRGVPVKLARDAMSSGMIAQRLTVESIIHEAHRVARPVKLKETTDGVETIPVTLPDRVAHL